MNLISAQFVWEEYGNTFNPLWNEQYPNTFGRFDITIQNISIAYGQNNTMTDFPTQPVVSYIETSFGLDDFLIFQNGNYIEIYDKNLILESQTFTGELVSNIDTLFYTNDTSKRNIAGVYKINNTALQLKVFTYNHTTNNLSILYSYNMTSLSDINSVAGLRHLGNTLLFTLDNPAKFVKANQTSGLTMTTLSFNSGGRFLEPLAFSDVDNDGNLEYMSYNAHRLYIFRDDGNLMFNYNSTSVIENAKMFYPDGVISAWKIVITDSDLVTLGGGSYKYNYRILAKKLDGSNLWNTAYNFTDGSGISSIIVDSSIAITNDYDDDLKPDVYVGFTDQTNKPSGIQIRTNYIVLKGTNGNILKNKTYDFGIDSNNHNFTSLTIADLDFDGYDDFINSVSVGYNFYSPKTNIDYILVTNQTSSSDFVCIPADINLDSYQEVVCVGRFSTMVYASNITNFNPTISLISFDPSTTISINQPLYMIISASDIESNTIKYNEKCNDTSDWGIESTNNARTCSFGNVGNYNVTVKVKDDYHNSYNTFSQNILVTTTGISCNNNGICETGETISNCPNDCTTSQPVVQVPYGSAIPSELVNVDDTNQGLLPTIYYGILGFLSGSLIPMMIIIFTFLIALIIIAIFTLARNVIEKGFK